MTPSDTPENYTTLTDVATFFLFSIHHHIGEGFRGGLIPKLSKRDSDGEIPKSACV